MGRVPTVKIIRDGNPDDCLIINESDFDPGTMTLWGVEPSRPEAPTDPTERSVAIMNAGGEVDPDNEDLWMGKPDERRPTVDAIQEILGWDITAAERDEAWSAWQGQ